MDLKSKSKISFIIFCICVIISMFFFIKQITKHESSVKINLIYLFLFIFNNELFIIIKLVL